MLLKTSFRPSFATFGLVLVVALMALYVISGKQRSLFFASEKAIKHDVLGSNGKSGFPSTQQVNVKTTFSLTEREGTSRNDSLAKADNEEVSTKDSKEGYAKANRNQPQSRRLSGSEPVTETRKLENELVAVKENGLSHVDVNSPTTEWSSSTQLSSSKTTSSHYSVYKSVTNNSDKDESGEVTAQVELVDNVMDGYKIEHNKRIEHINSVCNNYDITKNDAYKGTFEGTFMQSRIYNFTVCKVAKVGSTFLVQMLSILERGIDHGAFLLSIKRSHVHSSTNYFRSSREKARTQKTILISRDPYSRLYSAFIDKLYLPIMFGINYRILKVPYNKPNFNGHCPGTISFKQFLEHTVKEAFKGRNFDHHWAPISAYCHPCEVKPFLLMKQESFVKDVEFVLDTLNVTKEKRNFISKTLHNNRIEITIPGYVETIYGYARNEYVVNCLGWKGVAQRVWTSFQIQGYISQDIDFPSEKFEHSDRFLDHKYLSMVILDYIKTRPLSSEERKQQRQMYLCKAYEDVPKSIIVGLQEIFKYDFLVYNYTNVPPCW